MSFAPRRTDADALYYKLVAPTAGLRAESEPSREEVHRRMAATLGAAKREPDDDTEMQRRLKEMQRLLIARPSRQAQAPNHQEDGIRDTNVSIGHHDNVKGNASALTHDQSIDGEVLSAFPSVCD